MVRIGGAQIPVTKDIEKNIKHIKEAINWAAENKVEYLLTPEGSLSGYMNSFDTVNDMDIDNLLIDLQSHAALAQVGLILGTEVIETKPFGLVKQSQLRYYDQQGIAVGKYAKQMTIPGECSHPGDGPEIITMQHMSHTARLDIKMGSFICNDMWGQLDNVSCVPKDLFLYSNEQVNIIFHASNGFRGDDAGKNADERSSMRDFSDLHLWNASRYMVPILTVDNCYNINGEPDSGPTSSSSGVISNGEWLVKAKPSGTDYFYYDFKF
tara:strand:+ start:84 stop:884 length:801 start_codon:yes stop_codon:yes gene_type:complete